MMVSLIPFPLGRDTHGFVPLPMVQTLREFMTRGVLNVDCLEAALVLLSVFYDSNTTSVPSPGDHHYISHVELDELDNFVAV